MSSKDATLPADNPLVLSTGWRPQSPVRKVVTPRGMKKSVCIQYIENIHVDSKPPFLTSSIIMFIMYIFDKVCMQHVPTTCYAHVQSE